MHPYTVPDASVKFPERIRRELSRRYSPEVSKRLHRQVVWVPVKERERAAKNAQDLTRSKKPPRMKLMVICTVQAMESEVSHG